MKTQQITVKVLFEDGDYLTTRINTDLNGAKEYYLNRYFNVGDGGNDLYKKCISVELIESKP